MAPEKGLPQLPQAAQSGAANSIGTVAEVTPEGLVRVTLTRADSVQVGQLLELARLHPAPVYLGRLRIVAVRGTSAVGTLVSSRTPAQGDLVFIRLPSEGNRFGENNVKSP
jgi:hypothetical protein